MQEIGYLKIGKEEKPLFGFSFSLHCFFNWRALGHAFCDNAQLCGWNVSSARERVPAFSAFPDADAFSFDSWKPALWTVVRLFHRCDYFAVTFPDCGSVAGA